MRKGKKLKKESEIAKVDSAVINGKIVSEPRRIPFNYSFPDEQFFQDLDTLTIISKGNIKKYYKPQYRLQKWGWLSDSVRVIKNGTIPFTLVQ